MRHFLLWAAAVAGLLLAGPVRADPQCRKVIVSADPEFPPFAWYDGQALRGASVDVVIAVLQAIKLPYELRYVGPFSRILVSAEAGHIDIITELKRTPEREQYMAFAPTPIFSNPTAVFVRAEQTIKFNGRDDLRGLRGGVTRGTRFGGGLDEYVAENLKVDPGPGIKENFLKLEAQHIDYFISPYYPAQLYLMSSGDESKFRVLKPYVAEALNYVGWSRKSDCLDHLSQFDAMLKRYLQNINAGHVLDNSNQAWLHSPVMVR